jgi:hypothetical protein
MITKELRDRYFKLDREQRCRMIKLFYAGLLKERDTNRQAAAVWNDYWMWCQAQGEKQRRLDALEVPYHQLLHALHTDKDYNTWSQLGAGRKP